MSIFRLTTLVFIAAGLLAACSSAAPDGGKPDQDDCGMTVTAGLSIPLLLHNGPEECDYYFPGDASGLVAYSISSDVRIEPGTVLRFGQNAILYVEKQGRLTAVGTASERIVFEGEIPAHGSWYGICFQDNRESRLSHVDVRWGGKVYASAGTNCRGGIAGRWFDGSSEPVHITNTTVSGSYVNGLSAYDLELGDFSGNAFFDNAEYGVVAHARQVRNLDAGSDYSGADSGALNGRPYVYTAGHFQDAGQAHVWAALNAPYFVSEAGRHDYGDSITVHGDTMLILGEGTNIVFEGDSELYVYGGASFGAGGTVDHPVVLSGLDGTPGSWNGLILSNAPAILRNVHILGAGRPNVYPGSLVFVEIGTDLNRKEVSGVFIDGSASCAVNVWHDDLSLFDPFDVRYGAGNAENFCWR